MTDDDDTMRGVKYSAEIDAKISGLMNEMSEKTWMAIDGDKEPERFATERHLWTKAALLALARQLGIVEALLILNEGLETAEVVGVREAWIERGHRITSEAIEAQMAEDKEN